MKKLYLLLALAGLLLPYYFFGSFLAANGLNLSFFFQQLFANHISTFFAVDLVITAIAFLVFLYQEARKYRMKNWWAFIAAALLVGPSFALPLFLYFRQVRIEMES